VPTLEKSITIKAPVEKVFEYLYEPAHLPEIWPSFFEVKDVKPLPKGGHTFTWLYNMAGKPVHGTSETFEYVPNKKIVDKTYGDVESTFAWTFFGENGTTKVQFEAEYTTPPIFDKKFEGFVMRRNEFEADTLMANLKARFEF
jgi:uncharacterized protein YndB with AHSA1/START domain